MTRKVNVYTIRPDELRAGDVMQVTVTCHVMAIVDGIPVVQMYRCFEPYSTDENGIPQGSRIGWRGTSEDERAIIGHLFPVVMDAWQDWL